MRWQGIASWGGTLAVGIVALAIGAAIGGAAAGARVAAEAAPLDLASHAAAEEARAPRQVHRVVGRVVGVRDQLIRVRPPGDLPVPVHVRPQTLIRRAGERVGLDAIRRGDRVVAVGRVDEWGVLQARGILVRPAPPPRPPAEGHAGLEPTLSAPPR